MSNHVKIWDSNGKMFEMSPANARDLIRNVPGWSAEPPVALVAKQKAIAAAEAEAAAEKAKAEADEAAKVAAEAEAAEKAAAEVEAAPVAAQDEDEAPKRRRKPAAADEE
jgi:hypothetical protein